MSSVQADKIYRYKAFRFDILAAFLLTLGFAAWIFFEIHGDNDSFKNFTICTNAWRCNSRPLFTLSETPAFYFGLSFLFFSLCWTFTFFFMLTYYFKSNRKIKLGEHAMHLPVGLFSSKFIDLPYMNIIEIHKQRAYKNEEKRMNFGDKIQDQINIKIKHLNGDLIISNFGFRDHPEFHVFCLELEERSRKRIIEPMNF